MEDFLRKIEGKQVIVIGDVMIDAYLWGNVNRISPEAPVPVLSVTKRENRLGGAANVALNLKSLGVDPIICSVIGQDDDGHLYKDIMNENQLSTSGLIQSAERKTTKKTRFISNGQQLLRVDDEISYLISSKLENDLFLLVKETIANNNISAIIFEDYDKGVLTESLIKEICSIAEQNEILTSVDPKKNNYDFYKNVTLFKPNFKEFNEGGHLDILKADTKAIFKHAQEMIKERKIKFIFVTLSELGVFITDGENYHVIPAEFRQIRDVSGAGDTVISIATLLLISGYNMETIASVSNIAGGLVCEKAGVVSITKEDLIEVNLN